MTPNVTTEMISHFAGYLQAFEDDVRMRGEPDGPGAEIGTAASATPNMGGPPGGLSDEILLTAPTRSPQLSSYEDGFRPGGAEGRAPLQDDLLAAPIAGAHNFPLQPHQPGSEGPSGPGGGPPDVRITYREGGAETFAAILQSNRIADGDIILFDGVEMGEGGFGIDVPADAAAMLDALRAVVTPEDLPTLLDQNEVASYFRDRRDAMAEQRDADDERTDETTLNPAGVYVDGVLDGERETDSETVFRTLTLEPRTEPIETEDGVELRGSETGANGAFNVAAILDANEATLSLVVTGDRYSLDVIVQSNVAHDVDGAPSKLPSIEALIEMSSGGANADGARTVVTENVAEFVRSAGDLLSPIPGWGASPIIDWTVDVLEGDFLDISLIDQTNRIGDDDIVGGAMADTWLSAGHNLAANAAQFLSLSLEYDLIVIGGDYFDANLIYQTNVLFDGEETRGGSAPLETDAANTLLNEAAIERHGNPDYDDITPEIAQLVDRLEAREDGFQMTRALTEQLPNAASSSFDILYVTGDYFNLNIIDQLNIVFDRDLLIESSGDHGLTDSGNTLGNSALVVKAETLSSAQYLGGEHYSDSVLVQANLVADAAGLRASGSDDLASELIAFLNVDAQPMGEPVGEGLFAGLGTGGADDMLAGVMT